MYKYYLDDWGSAGLRVVATRLETTFRSLVSAFTRAGKKVLASLDFLERQTNKLLKRLESKSENEQRKLVEYVFIAHKVLVGLGFVLIYLLASGSV
ncbi:MAG: hypothetical protein QW705_04415 [Zestosphaera sp.]